METIVEKLQPEVKGLTQQAIILEKKVDDSAGKLQSLDEEVSDLHERALELEDSVEKLDNLQRKNNLKTRGLKEGREGKDLVGYLI